MWTVVSSVNVPDDVSIIDNDPTHAYLILSQRSSTMVCLRFKLKKRLDHV